MSRKALFLDRDGVINREHGSHATSLEAFVVLPDVPEALALAQRAGWALVVITNQSGVALGLYDHAMVHSMHAYLHRMLAEHDVRLTDILYCPHHPSTGRCLCRKPGGLLLERAIVRHDIDPAASVMVGDRERDMEAAASVGVKGILVSSNAPLLPVVRELIATA
jgi:D-glycero-D-manno-heptose 1,7-bisphosphate phosphatase